MCVGGQPWGESDCAVAMAVAGDVSGTCWDDRLIALESLRARGSTLAFESQRITRRCIEVGLRGLEMGRVSIGRG